jgi:hypothetical protein
MRLVHPQVVHMMRKLDFSQFGGSPNTMTDLLCIRDNFAIVANQPNSKGILYYILTCTRSKFVVSSAFRCIWANEFDVRDHIVEGLYFQRWCKGRSQNYIYLDRSNPTYVHSHLVKTCGFEMISQQYCIQGDDSVYYLLDKHHQQILISLLEPSSYCVF